MRRKIFLLACVLAISVAPLWAGDDLTRVVQVDLLALGYDPGSSDGESSTKTAIAISQFQAAHDLEVTGEVTPQLAGILKAVGRDRYQPAPPAAASPTASTTPAPNVSSMPAPTAAAPDPLAATIAQQGLQARQQACLQQKAEAAQKAKKKKRGLGRLARAAARTAGRFGLGGGLGQIAGDVYSATATADDLTAAAKDLGLTKDDVEACRNPPVEGGGR